MILENGYEELKNLKPIRKRGDILGPLAKRRPAFCAP